MNQETAELVIKLILIFGTLTAMAGIVAAFGSGLMMMTNDLGWTQASKGTLKQIRRGGIVIMLVAGLATVALALLVIILTNL